MRILLFSFAFGMIFSLVRISRADQDFSKAEIKVIQVGNQIAMLQGTGGNIGVSYGEDGILLIDDQYAPLSEKIKAAVKTFKTGPIKFVLNTHWHQDHTGGNEAFGETATIVSHINVRKRLETDQFIEIFNKTVAASPKQALPVITFNESINIHFNQQDMDVIHLPRGHTDGDSVVYFKQANVLHAGDLFFNGLYPFIDLDHGGSISGYIQNVKSLLEITNEETVIIPGHGPLANYADLKNFLKMLQSTKSFVQQQMKMELSLADIQKNGIPAEWNAWRGGFLNDAAWIGILYKGLSQESV